MEVSNIENFWARDLKLKCDLFVEFSFVYQIKKENYFFDRLNQFSFYVGWINILAIIFILINYLIWILLIHGNVENILNGVVQ